jgi:phage I-like protein/cation transport regulator ChaB
MPYASDAELPPAVKALPKHAQDIFRAAFNAAYQEHGEEAAFKIAWAAVKRKYEKNADGAWVKERDAMADPDVTQLARKAMCRPLVRAPAPPGEAPTEFQILVRGENVDKDGKVYIYNEVSTKYVMETWRQNKLQLTIDYEHATEEPASAGSIATEGAPAAGWFDLEDRPDGLWAVNVDWKEPALGYIQTGKYKYFSDVFYYTKDGVVVELKSIGLTNTPKMTKLIPLAAKDTRVPTISQKPPVQLRLSKDHKLSHDQIRDAVGEALKKQFEETAAIDGVQVVTACPWATDVYDDKVVFIFEEKIYEIGYKIEGDLAVLVGERVEVVRTYEAAKAAQKDTDMDLTEHAQKLKDHGALLDGHHGTMKAHHETLKAHHATLGDHHTTMKAHHETLKAHHEALKALTTATDTLSGCMKASADAAQKLKDETAAQKLKDDAAAVERMKLDPENLVAEGDDAAKTVLKAECKALLDVAVSGTKPALTPAERLEALAKLKAGAGDKTYVTTFITEKAKLKEAERASGTQERTVPDPIVFAFGEKSLARCKAAPTSAFKGFKGGPAADPVKMSEFTLATCKHLQGVGVVERNGVKVDYSKIFEPAAVLKAWNDAKERDASWREGQLVLNLPAEVKFHTLNGDGPY